MRLLDFALIRNFAVVARTGSIRLAAVQVGRTRSALSLQMHRLERSVGRTLLDRSGSGVPPKAAGERLLAHAEALIARHDEILADMSGTALEGTISLGCPEDYSIAFLPGLSSGFCALHPAGVCLEAAQNLKTADGERLPFSLSSTPTGGAAGPVGASLPSGFVAKKALRRRSSDAARSAAVSVATAGSDAASEGAGAAVRLVLADACVRGFFVRAAGLA